jgi:DDE superfamily endonuclease
MESDTGATHDSAILNSSEFYQREADFFEDETGYIIGDSAYRITNRMVKPFSEPELHRSKDPQGHRALFNKILSSGRVRVEHAFGLMKCRFPTLARLHVVVGSEKENKRVSNPFYLVENSNDEGGGLYHFNVCYA